MQGVDPAEQFRQVSPVASAWPGSARQRPAATFAANVFSNGGESQTCGSGSPSMASVPGATGGVARVMRRFVDGPLLDPLGRIDDQQPPIPSATLRHGILERHADFEEDDRAIERHKPCCGVGSNVCGSWPGRTNVPTVTYWPPICSAR